MKFISQQSKKFIGLLAALTAIGIILISSLVYARVSPVIRHNVFIGAHDVGGMSRDEALHALAQLIETDIKDDVITIVIDGQPFPIQPTAIDLTFDTVNAVERAWEIGRTGNPFMDLVKLIRLPFSTIIIPIDRTFDAQGLASEIHTIAELVDKPGRDIRLFIENGTVSILTDTKIGYTLNQDSLYALTTDAIKRRMKSIENISLEEIKPSLSYESAVVAKREAEQMLSQPFTLIFNSSSFTVTPERIGTWLTNSADGTALSVSLNDREISSYVTSIASQLDAEPQAPELILENGKVTEFTAPKEGRQLDQDKTKTDIISLLERRRAAPSKDKNQDDEDQEEETITLSVDVQKPEVTDLSAKELGIVELIGTASTRFTGSPANRISNIKNGVKFLTGMLIAPGEEFSTIGALGRIDNTTGYLPELVIKEDRTVPEFGGGLCQVSTTLFRATMNTGLPITARRNHSYRVSYYEKDADGEYIGPGLDATIYSPNPDFKFINDTGHNILIQGHVEGDKITFDFYGTKDGRISGIDGPHTLSTTPAGEPIYVETDELEPGVQKKLESAHAGGTAVATYTVTYPDGTVKTEEYKSFYRNWPARYLVGADPQAVDVENTEAVTEETTL